MNVCKTTMNSYIPCQFALRKEAHLLQLLCHCKTFETIEIVQLPGESGKLLLCLRHRATQSLDFPRPRTTPVSLGLIGANILDGYKLMQLS